MSEECTHDCSSCASDCSGSTRNDAPPLHPDASVRRVYAVCGSKGGVGRSTVTALLASLVQKKHLQAAILDADITSPCIPCFFGLSGRVSPDDRGMFPMESQSGVQVMSVNLIIPTASDPVLARGSLVDNTLKKFWAEVIWEDVDLMLVDMPAGTGEVSLSVMRNLPLDGIIVVTEPGRAAAIMTEKTLKMAKALKLPVVGMVVNRATGLGTPGETSLPAGYAAALAKQYGVTLSVSLPYDPQLAAFSDDGEIEMFNTDILDPFLDRIF